MRMSGPVTVFLAIAMALARWMPAAMAEPGVTRDTIMIGAFGPITGPAAFIGLGGRDGMNMAVREINDAGGVNGRKLKVVFEDDGFSPARALGAVKKLIDEDDVFMLFSVAGSNSTVGTIDYVKRRQRVMYVSLASAPEVTNPFSRYLFRGASNEVQRYGEVDSEFLARFLQARRIAILGGHDEYAKNEAEAIDAKLRGWWHITPVDREQFNVGDKDFTPQLLAVKKADPDVVVLCANPTEGSIILRQMRDLGMTQQVFGGSAMVQESVPLNARSAAEGLTATYNLPFMMGSTDPAMKTWEAAWHKDYPNAPPGRPNHYDLMAYTDVYAVAEALKRAGSDLTTDTFIAALETLHGWRVGPIATPRTFTASNHTGNLALQPMVVLNGHWLPVNWHPEHPTDMNGAN